MKDLKLKQLEDAGVKISKMKYETYLIITNNGSLLISKRELRALRHLLQDIYLLNKPHKKL